MQNRNMNAFEKQASAPPTEQEYIRRDEDIARSQERRLLARDLAFEYRSENWVEMPEFSAKPPRRAERLQGELFEEVA